MTEIVAYFLQQQVLEDRSGAGTCQAPLHCMESQRPHPTSAVDLPLAHPLKHVVLHGAPLVWVERCHGGQLSHGFVEESALAAVKHCIQPQSVSKNEPFRCPPL